MPSPAHQAPSEMRHNPYVLASPLAAHFCIPELAVLVTSCSPELAAQCCITKANSPGCTEPRDLGRHGCSSVCCAPPPGCGVEAKERRPIKQPVRTRAPCVHGQHNGSLLLPCAADTHLAQVFKARPITSGQGRRAKLVAMQSRVVLCPLEDSCLQRGYVQGSRV